MSSLRWVLRLGRSGRGRLVLAIALGTLASGTAVGLTAVSAWLISRASEHPPVLHLMVAIVAVRAFGVGRGVFRYLERLTGHDSSFRTLGDLRVATIRRLERVVPTRSVGHGLPGDPGSSGELLARFVGDVDGLQDLWVRVLLPASSAALVGAGSVALVAALAPSAGLVLAASVVLAAVVAPAVSAVTARGAGARSAPLRADHQVAVLDLLAGASELAVYGGIEARLDQLDALDRAMAAAEVRSAWAAGLGASIASLAAGASTWACLWLGAGAVERHQLAPVSLAVVVLVPLAIHEVVGGLAPAAHALPALAASAGRVREVLELPDAVREPAHPVPLPAGPYGLRLRDVRAGWDAGDEVLGGVDLDVAPGSCVVVTAPSGGGKSTLAAVLLRFLDPTSGTVELTTPAGATELSSLDGDDVRRVVGWCAQDAYVFDSTIEANLRLARPEATADDLARALRAAHLDGWVASLPAGLDTLVGEHGRAMSGGQRQRLALARVALADRPIVVFDEPTEHLDEPTARGLAADLVTATAERTVIVLTHRPELFERADAVVRLDHGVVHGISRS